MSDTDSTIPEKVLDALEYAREDGSYNMLDSRGVTYVIESAPSGDFADALTWIADHNKRYMEALVAMGARVTARREAAKA